MTEKKLIVTDLKIEYEGLFDSEELFRLLEDWFRQNGYKKNEIRHVERVKEKGKEIDFEIMPEREVSDYVRYDIDVRVRINNLIQTSVKKNGKKFKINKGKISIKFNAFLVTDVSEKWESKPSFFFMRAIFDKFLGKKYLDKFEKGLETDVQNLHSELKAYLNLQRYTTPA